MNKISKSGPPPPFTGLQQLPLKQNDKNLCKKVYHCTIKVESFHHFKQLVLPLNIKHRRNSTLHCRITNHTILFQVLAHILLCMERTISATITRYLNIIQLLDWTAIVCPGKGEYQGLLVLEKFTKWLVNIRVESTVSVFKARLKEGKSTLPVLGICSTTVKCRASQYICMA